MRTWLIAVASMLVGSLAVSTISIQATYMPIPEDFEYEGPKVPPDWVFSRVVARSFDLMVSAIFVLGVWLGSSALMIPTGIIIGMGVSNLWLRRLPEPIWNPDALKSSASDTA